MQLIKNPIKMYKLIQSLKLKQKSIGFVPTMGFLHEGHLSLARKSVTACDITVMSIYVNPLQFGPKEDFNAYPRDLKKDMKLAAAAGVDYIFAPDHADMYPEVQLTRISVKELSTCLCGFTRPEHFDGVTTVVTKLFNIIMPNIAYFGQKDAQQAIIIKRMVKDLNQPVQINVLPIIREPDGLAMSSRNKYLTISQRKDSLILYSALKLAQQQIQAGQTSAAKISATMKRLISQTKSAIIVYIVIVDAEDLSPRKKIFGKILIALAVKIGKVKLIDNIVIKRNISNAKNNV